VVPGIVVTGNVVTETGAADLSDTTTSCSRG
jgi:hypothetical protein